MQFRNPEILYALFALAIPVIVHLFQLQRFIKVPFTNVALLQKVQVQSRKSSRLKRWLILISRMLAFTALIFAFAQPFSGNNSQTKSQITLFLDNSASMNIQGNDGKIFNKIQRELIENLPAKNRYTLYTLDDEYDDMTASQTKEVIKQLSISPLTQDWDVINRKMNTSAHQNGEKLYISDFQWSETNPFRPDSLARFIALQDGKDYDISIDSAYQVRLNNGFNRLKIRLHSQGGSRREISLYATDDSGVISKNSLLIPADTTLITELQIPEEHPVFSLHIDTDDRFPFNNIYRFATSGRKKVKVLCIGKNNDFLRKIYDNEEFDYREITRGDFSVKTLQNQDLIILNEPKRILPGWDDLLLDRLHDGRSLILIPPADIQGDSWNAFLEKLQTPPFDKAIRDTLKITGIRYAHPLFKGVFEKQVHNFQYPATYLHYPYRRDGELPVMEYQDGTAFVSEIKKGKGHIYRFSAPLDRTSSDFSRSPLVVPLFYNMAKQSAGISNHTYRTGETADVPVNIHLNPDEVLHLTGNRKDRIPPQEILPGKVLLHLGETVLSPGFYTVTYRDSTVQTLAVNPPKGESSMHFFTPDDFRKNNHPVSADVSETLDKIFTRTRTREYYPLLLLLALLFILSEMLIIKYYKP